MSCQTVSWAGSPAAAPVSLENPAAFEAPAGFATLEETHHGTNGKLVVLLQDAHSNLSGQENLAGAVGAVLKKYDTKLVLSEGGEGDCSLDALKEAGSPAVWKRTAKTLLMQGKINGEEYLQLTASAPMKIVGIEDMDLYFESVERYAALASGREERLAYLSRVRSAIEKLKKKTYPSDILRYEAEGAARSDAAAPFGVLAGLASKYGISTSDLSHFSRAASIQAGESEIDFDAASLEQRALVEEMHAKGGAEELLAELESAAAGKVTKASQRDFFRRLWKIAAERGVKKEAYPQLARYGQYLEEFAKIDLGALLDEVRTAEERVYDAALKDRPGRLLRSIDRYTSLLETAYRIQMTSDEFSIFLRNFADFRASGYQAFLNRQLADRGWFADIIPYREEFDGGEADLAAFYESVGRRDGAFLEKAEKAMADEKENVAVLVAGGYHTPNLKRLFADKGYSYAVLTPVVTAETDQARYEKSLLAPLRKETKTVETGHRSSGDGVRAAALGLVTSYLQKPVLTAREARVVLPQIPIFREALRAGGADRVLMARWERDLTRLESRADAALKAPVAAARLAKNLLDDLNAVEFDSSIGDPVQTMVRTALGSQRKSDYAVNKDTMVLRVEPTVKTEKRLVFGTKTVARPVGVSVDETDTNRRKLVLVLDVTSEAAIRTSLETIAREEAGRSGVPVSMVRGILTRYGLAAVLPAAAPAPVTANSAAAFVAPAASAVPSLQRAPTSSPFAAFVSEAIVQPGSLRVIPRGPGLVGDDDSLRQAMYSMIRQILRGPESPRWADIMEVQRIFSLYDATLQQALVSETRGPQIAEIRASIDFLNDLLSFILLESFVYSRDSSYRSEMSTIPWTDRGQAEYVVPFVADKLSHELAGRDVQYDEYGISTGAVARQFARNLGPRVPSGDLKSRFRYSGHDYMTGGRYVSIRGGAVEGLFVDDGAGNYRLEWIRRPTPGMGHQSVRLSDTDAFIQPDDLRYADELRKAFAAQPSVNFSRTVDRYRRDATQVFASASFDQQDLTRDFPAGTPASDFIVLQNVWMHVPEDDRVAALARLTRKAKPDGYLVFLTSTDSPSQELRERRAALYEIYQVRVDTAGNRRLVPVVTHHLYDSLKRLSNLVVLPPEAVISSPAQLATTSRYVGATTFFGESEMSLPSRDIRRNAALTGDVFTVPSSGVVSARPYHPKERFMQRWIETLVKIDMSQAPVTAQQINVFLGMRLALETDADLQGIFEAPFYKEVIDLRLSSIARSSQYGSIITHFYSLNRLGARLAERSAESDPDPFWDENNRRKAETEQLIDREPSQLWIVHSDIEKSDCGTVFTESWRLTF